MVVVHRKMVPMEPLVLKAALMIVVLPANTSWLATPSLTVAVLTAPKAEALSGRGPNTNREGKQRNSSQD